MKLDEVSSQRLNLLRLPLIVGVVFIHAYRPNVILANGSIGIAQQGWLSDSVRFLISNGVARVAVPLFYLMSGYFFFLNFTWSFENYRKKLHNRIKTLLIPFLFWNLLTLLVFAVAQSLPATQIYFAGKHPVRDYSAYEYFNAILGLDNMPIAYHFWFIRDLFLVVLLVPLIQWMLKTAPIFFLVTLGTLWFFRVWPIYMPSVVAFTFFYAGARVAYSEGSLFRFDGFGKIATLVFCLLLFALLITREYPVSYHILNTSIIFGVVSALYLTKLALNYGKLREFLLWSAGFSFFVFAIHAHLLIAARKLIFQLIEPKTDAMILLLYFCIPVLVIALAMLFYGALKRVTPTFASLISGSR